jgi:hypothetical protein
LRRLAAWRGQAVECRAYAGSNNEHRGARAPAPGADAAAVFDLGGPMPSLVYDAAVIAEWQRRVARGREARQVHGFLFRALIAGFLAAALLKPPLYVFVAVFAALIGCVLTEGLFSKHLRCPHCGRTPTRSLGLYLRLPDQPAEADHCPHCMYSLKGPV